MLKLNVLIGRFQPLHEGHEALISQAVKSCDKLVILIGSANKPRSIKNPWTFKERRDAIKKYLEIEKISPGKVMIFPVNDYKYSDHAWVADVIETIKNATQGLIARINLVGHYKRGNSYLKYFPQWSYTEIDCGIDLNATEVRREMMMTGHPAIHQSVMNDFEFFSKEADKFSAYPYPETLSFQCSDALITCAGHVLLIKRKIAPGAGNWAFPGGFKNYNETFLDCAIREGYEETNLRVPEKVFRASLVHQRMFDSPDRGAGIPRVTMAHYFHLEPDADGSVPRANGGDDAMEARWFTISEAMNELDMHDDHGDIFHVMTSSSAIPAYRNSRIIL
jgi:bifunctional NMN adenylyltransferase/nudix hydrolase